MNCEKTVSTFGDTVRLKGVWIRGYQELASKLLDLNRRSVNEVNLVICFHFVYLSRCQCHELPCTDRSFPD